MSFTKPAALLLFLALFAAPTPCTSALAGEPPALNPFQPGPSEREDAIPGYVEMSDGRICYGRLYLTRDARLKVYDAAQSASARSPCA
jgi:hypothetical protein